MLTLSLRLFPVVVDLSQVLVDVNERDGDDVPLLHWAAINDRRGVVKYLLKRVHQLVQVNA